VLAALFAKSFLPDYIHFANDGPLGAAESAAGRMPAAMTGVWLDLNWVGNEGVASAPSLSNLLCGVLSPIAYAKVIVPLSLLLLGCAAWVFFRQCGFAPWVCTVGGLAAALNGDRFSVAAWGLSIWVLGTAAVFLALAALMAANRRRVWAFVMLAGFATGLGVMEGFDTGAIFSLVVAAFALWLAWVNGTGEPGKRILMGLGRVAVVALCAGFIATYTLGTLMSTQVKGVVGMAQDKETRERRYSEATTWSLPKIEALRVLIPGLFGYRMDTPDGGAYWGSVGQNPGLPQIKEAAAKGDPQAKAALGNPTLFRHSGSGEYGGVLVVLLAAFAIAQAARAQAGAFTEVERRLVWFWAGIALLALLFAFGKHAPFYKLFYSLPYASTIRNPVKFMHPFHLALIVLCGYGLHALAKQFIKPAAVEPGRLTEHVGAWWNSVTGFERRWTLVTFGLAALGMLGLLLYGSARKELEKHLVSVAFSEDLAKAIASHSIGEVGWFVFFLALSAGAVAVALSGYWSGARTRWAGVTLGVLLAADLARANTPWIVYWNYQEKYATNPIIELLRQSPHERRVQSLPFNIGEFSVFQQLYGMEWTQHLFLYNNIQCLDITQEPRSTAENKAYREAFLGRAETLARLWELTNTRFIFGLNGTNFLNSIATQLDPGQGRFRIHTPFDIVARPGVGRATRLDQVTVVTNGPGQFALIEFTGALPRAKLYPHWQVMTNDTEVLARLANPAFKPQDTVIVSTPLPAATNDPGTNAGEVKFLAYAPKRIQLEATAAAPSILLLNDKHSPNWKVTVDGQPATLLRCNYLMRGVSVPAGRHTIEFRYEPAVTGLYVTLAAMVCALFLLLLVTFTRQADNAPPVAKPAAPPPAK
ncbi:MAG: hypothetical protein ACKODH_09590, partial [Limisphaerales bacterium]